MLKEKDLNVTNFRIINIIEELEEKKNLYFPMEYKGFKLGHKEFLTAVGFFQSKFNLLPAEAFSQTLDLIDHCKRSGLPISALPYMAWHYPPCLLNKSGE